METIAICIAVFIVSFVAVAALSCNAINKGEPKDEDDCLADKL